MDEVYKVKMIGLYGTGEDGYTAYFQSVGVGCWNFTPNRELASELTEEEAREVINSTEFYLKQFNACKLVAIGKIRLGNDYIDMTIEKQQEVVA